MEYFIECITKKYMDFSGRARRSELWYYMLFVSIISIVIQIIENILNINYTKVGGPINWLFSLAFLLPGSAVIVRRLHDIGKSGWWILLIWAFLIMMYTFLLLQLYTWLLLILLPIMVIEIIFIIWYCTDSQYGENKYGPNPKGIGNKPKEPEQISQQQ